MKPILGWLFVAGVLLSAIGVYEWTGAALNNQAMPPFLVLFLIAEGVVAFLYTWRHALALFIGAHLIVQFVFAPSASAFDMFGGNPAVVLRVVSFAIAGLTIIALIGRLKSKTRAAEEAQRALTISEAQFRGMISQAPIPIAVYGADGSAIFWNQAVIDLFGIDANDQKEILDNYNLLEDQSIVEAGLIPAINKAMDGESVLMREVLFEIVPGGLQLGQTAPLWLDASIFPVKSGDGTVVQLVFLMNDVTREKDFLERLSQSQKLESIGQLTGGLAHDFNNLLTIVLGNLEIAQIDLDQQHPSAKLIDQAYGAAGRGADLTRKLLAFARKQPLEPLVVDVRTVINGMHDLLVRTLGADIAIEVIGAAGLWRCEVDAGQLENVILNLAINARDAMKEGGKLTIETGNAFLDDEYAAAHPGVVSGQYAMLAVSDTGCGMTTEVRNSAFEPFFTTKDTGKGSGLGLSMAFGFARQSGGYIEMYSEVGDGTTIKVYLPRTQAESGVTQEPLPDEEPQGAGETILVVEDDEGVRNLTRNALGRLGYIAVTASDSSSALDVLAKSREIKLILSDVVLPGGVNGPKLVEQALHERPDLKVLYMSGYTENAIIHDGKLDLGVELLQKPFTKLQLARKVYSALRK